MALSGHDTPIAVISDAGTKSTYTGTLNGVVAGQLVRVGITAMADSGGQTPSAWTVTLGPDTLTFAAGDASSNVWGVAAEFWGIATTSGNLTLTVSTVSNCRALDAHANLIDGFDPASPIAAANTANSFNTNATSLTAPNGVTPGAAGNAILGCLSVNGGGATGMAVTGADGSITGQSGTNAFNDHSWCYAYAVGAPPATETFDYSWTGGSGQPRPAAAWVEIKADAGGAAVDAPTGAYVLTGYAPSIARQLRADAAAGVYTLTGFAPTITVAANINVPPGSYALAGYAPQLVRDLRIDVPAGSYAVTGLAPTIAVAGSVNVPVGSYSLTGFAPTIHKPVGSDATWGGAWATWGASGATWTTAATISVDAGAYTLTGFAPAVTRQLSLAPPTGAYALTGHAPSLTRSLVIAPGVGSYSIAGYAPALVTAGTIAVDAGSYAITGFAPSVLRSLRIDAPSGSYSITGYVPTIVTSGAISMPVGAYTLVGHAPVLRRSLLIAAPTGVYTLTGNAPLILVAGSATRRVALAADSRTGVIVLTPANGVTLSKTANGA